MLKASDCHGRHRFTGRPPGGTDPWDWWRESFAKDVLLYLGVPGGELEPDLWAVTRWTRQGALVELHYKLTGVQTRIALTHEMHHLMIGGVCHSRCDRQEQQVVRETARWLIPDVEDLCWRLRRQSMTSVAHDLLVQRHIIWDRLHAATAAERSAVDAVMLEAPRWVAGARAGRSTLVTAA